MWGGFVMQEKWHVTMIETICMSDLIIFLFSEYFGLYFYDFNADFLDITMQHHKQKTECATTMSHNSHFGFLCWKHHMQTQLHQCTMYTNEIEFQNF